MQSARRSRRIAGMQPEAKDAPVIPALVVSKLLKSSRAVKMARVKNLSTNGAPEPKVEPNKANAKVERPKTARGQKRTASTIGDTHISKAKEPKSSKGKEENNAKEKEKETPAKSAGRRKSRSSQPEAQGKKDDKAEKKSRASIKEASIPECVADIPRENEPSNIPTPNPGSIVVTDPDTDIPAPAAPAETEGGRVLDDEQTSSEISDELKH